MAPIASMWAPCLPQERADERWQSIAQRDHAHDLQAIYRESCRGVEADLQGDLIDRTANGIWDI